MRLGPVARRPIMLSVMTTDASSLLTVGQLATQLQLGRTTVYRLLASGVIPSARIGNKILRVRRADLDAWLAQQVEA